MKTNRTLNFFFLNDTCLGNILLVSNQFEVKLTWLAMMYRKKLNAALTHMGVLLETVLAFLSLGSFQDR